MASAPATCTQHTSFCRLCEAFCGTVVTVENGRPTRVSPDRDNPHTQGHICVKGTAIVDVANDPTACCAR